MKMRWMVYFENINRMVIRLHDSINTVSERTFCSPVQSETRAVKPLCQWWCVFVPLTILLLVLFLFRMKWWTTKPREHARRNMNKFGY